MTSKALWGALGLASFFYILRSYGFERLAADLGGLGFWKIPLILSFLPTVFCYALAWALVTPEVGVAKVFPLMRFTIISIAWNNLSPFVKVLGEPVRVGLLERWIDRKQATKSMILYNLVHALGTLGSFFFASLALLLLYPVPGFARTGLLLFLFSSPLLIMALYGLPHFARRFLGRKSHRNKLVLAGFWVHWSFSKIRIFSRKYPTRMWIAVAVEIVARFVEGGTFYVAFRALGQAQPLIPCALLDVGRALLDNIFFFVPYQVGKIGRAHV